MREDIRVLLPPSPPSQRSASKALLPTLFGPNTRSHNSFAACCLRASLHAHVQTAHARMF